MFDILFDPGRFRRKPVDGAFWLYYACILLGCIGIQLSNLSIGRWGRDAQALELAVETGGRLGASSLGDYAVAALGPYLGIPQLPNLIPTILLVFIVSRISYQGSSLEKLIILFLTFPVIFQLQFVSKESIVTLFVILVYIFMVFFKNVKLRSIFVASIILSMAMLFRNYYYISLAFAVLIFSLRKNTVLIPAMLASLIVVSFIPEIRDRLLDARYLVYRNVSVDAASIIPMKFHGYDPISFLGNYVLSIPFYLFPLVLNVRLQEIYMQIYIIFAGIVIFKSMKNGDKAVSAALLGLVCTFPVFVAEVGTLARHLSGILPLGYIGMHFSKLHKSCENNN